MAWHATGVTFCLVTRAILAEPCPSWPVWNVKRATAIARVAEMMRSEREKGIPAPGPASRPLALIAAGSLVDDLMGRLAQIQAEHSGAQVRAGNRGTWEIWPAPHTS